jgi:hypothetical protein
VTKYTDQYGKQQTIPADGMFYKGNENAAMKPELYSVGIQPVVECRYLFDAANKNPIHDNSYVTNRLMPEFKQHSSQMVRLADLIGQITQKPAPSYEYMAKDEYERYGGHQNYPRMLQEKLKSIQKARIDSEIKEPIEGKKSDKPPTCGNLIAA